MSFKNGTVKNFTSKLGSADYSPGGGAAAALIGSAGAALVEKVIRINNKREEKKKPGSVQLDSLRKLSQTERTKNFFLDLMDRDAEAFKKLTVFSKEDRQNSAYQKALEKAADVPFAMAQSVIDPLKVALGEASRTSAWLASDLAEAALLLEAAFSAARLNVEINLKTVKSVKFVKSRRVKLNALESRIRSLSRAIQSKAKV